MCFKCFNERSYNELQRTLNENYFYFKFGGNEVCLSCIIVYLIITLVLFGLVVTFGGYGSDFRKKESCYYVDLYDISKSKVDQVARYKDYFGFIELCGNQKDVNKCYEKLNLTYGDSFSCAVDHGEFLQRNNSYEIFNFYDYKEELETATYIAAGLIFPFLALVIIITITIFCLVHFFMFYMKSKYHRNLVKMRRKRDEEVLKIDRILYDIEDVEGSTGIMSLKKHRKVFNHLRNTAIKNREKIVWKFHPSFCKQLKYYTLHICMFFMNVCCSMMVGIFVIIFMATVKFQAWWIILTWFFVIFFFSPFFVVNSLFCLMIYNSTYYLTDTRVIILKHFFCGGYVYHVLLMEIEKVTSKYRSTVEIVKKNGNRVILFKEVGSPKILLNILNDKIRKEKMEMDNEIRMDVM